MPAYSQMSRRPSKRLILSYILDWIAVVAIALIGYGFYHVTPNWHPFSLVDLSISYPFKEDTVTITVAAVVAVLFPAAVTFAVVFFFVPGPHVTMQLIKGKATRQLIELKAWEWNTAWLGLALSLASAFTITQGAKLFGKPRPSAIARCQPDLSAIDRFTVGGYGQDISPRWVLVTRGICTNPDIAMINDAFQSWPSGHSSLAWSGLLYLTLWLCAKFAVVLPYLPSQALSPEPGSSESAHWNRSDVKSGASTETAQRPILSKETISKSGQLAFIQHRDEAAAPPTWLTFLVFVPCGAAVYICGSRYFDYAHHGFDIISGAVIGIVTSYVSFRWYHLPISKGSGWSWGPRSPRRAFGVGVGMHGFVGEERQHMAQPAVSDIEMGSMPPSNVNGNASAYRWENGQNYEPINETRVPAGNERQFASAAPGAGTAY